MNNKIYFLLIVLPILTASCRKALDITAVQISQKELPNCQKTSCPELDIEYLTVGGSTNASEKINAEIKDFVIQSLYIGEEESGSTALTVEQAMKDFIKLYRTHSAEFPNLSAEYFAEITVLQNFNSKNLLSIRCRNYLYTGGAHGFGSVTYKNFDPKTGTPLYYEDLFEDVSAFEKFAEIKFRKQNEVPATGNINATGFWFDNDAFYLPETFGVSKEFVTLQYNQYEIASYAAGPIVVEVPIADVRDLLKIAVE